jgi:hypothetical protein
VPPAFEAFVVRRINARLWQTRNVLRKAAASGEPRENAVDKRLTSRGSLPARRPRGCFYKPFRTRIVCIEFW